MKKMFLLILLSSCAKEDLIPLGIFEHLDYASVSANFCTSAPTASKHKIKYIFVLDHSQSNQPGFLVGDVDSTDPNGRRRYSPMARFVNNLDNDPNNIVTFSLINFNDSAFFPDAVQRNPEPDIVASSNVIDLEANEFIRLIQQDWIGTGTSSRPIPYDSGFTNYELALKKIEALIASDAKNESINPIKPVVKSEYKIIFASDGVPRINTTTVQTFVPNIQLTINSVLNIKNIPTYTPFISDITFNTVYYYNNTPIAEAQDLLKLMADTGEGQYHEFGGSQDIGYQVFAPPSRDLKNVLVDVFIENKNAVWWENGSLRQNVSGDGLPDFIKREAGYSGRDRDSDDNGVSDLSEYKNKLCIGTTCTTPTFDPYSVCDGFEPYTDTDGSRQFRSTAQDGFNDCEKFSLGADLSTFNSNGDLIPDFIKLKNQLSYLPKTNDSFLVPHNDGHTNYMKLKLGLPISIAADKVPANYRTRKQTLSAVKSSDPATDCYNLEVSDVAILSPVDQIRVWIVQNSLVVDNKPFAKIAEKSLNNARKVVFSNEDFK